VPRGPKSVEHIIDSDSDNGFAKFDTERYAEKINIRCELREKKETKNTCIRVMKRIIAKIATPNANRRKASQKGEGVYERHPGIKGRHLRT